MGAAVEQAKWLVDNLHENIPLGLGCPVSVTYAHNRAQSSQELALQQQNGGYGMAGCEGMGGMNRFSPYGMPMDPSAQNFSMGAQMAAHMQTGAGQNFCGQNFAPLQTAMTAAEGMFPQLGNGQMGSPAQEQCFQALQGLHGAGMQPGGAPGGPTMDMQCLQGLGLSGMTPGCMASMQHMQPGMSMPGVHLQQGLSQRPQSMQTAPQAMPEQSQAPPSTQGQPPGECVEIAERRICIRVCQADGSAAAAAG